MKKIYKFESNEAAKAKALYEVLHALCKGKEQSKHCDIRYTTWFDLKHDKIVIEVEELKDED